MVDLATLGESVLLVLGLPLVTAFGLRWAAHRLEGAQWREQRLEPLATMSVVPFLCLAVFAMFAWQAPEIVEHGAQLLRLLPPLLVFFIVIPLLATAAARVLGLSGPQRVTLTMVTTARNSPIALGIAAAAFPDRPMIAVAVVVGPLIELPVLALLSQLIRPRSAIQRTQLG